MKIGVIGSGKVGSALGAWMAKEGFSLSFTSRDPQHAYAAAQKAGHGAKAMTTAELIQNSDVLLLTVPFGEISSALTKFGDGLIGKTLVDVTNPITPDHSSLTIGHTDSGAEHVAKRFPGALVVKAFNAVFAEVYESQKPRVNGQTISILFAGDHPGAKASVREIISRLGFDAVDAGPLRNARYLEPLSLLNITLGRVLGFGTQIGFSLARVSE